MPNGWGMMRGAEKRAPRAAALFAFAAILLQALLFQPHVHAIGPITARIPVHTATLAAAAAADECVLCRELAQSGTFVAAAPPLLKAGALNALPVSAMLPPAPIRDARPRIWNSRGPPWSIAS